MKKPFDLFFLFLLLSLFSFSHLVKAELLTDSNTAIGEVLIVNSHDVLDDSSV